MSTSRSDLLGPNTISQLPNYDTFNTVPIQPTTDVSKHKGEYIDIKKSLPNTDDMEINSTELALDTTCIGKGFFSSVYKATWRGSTVAVKVIQTGLNQQQLTIFKSEAEIHKKLRPHSAVVQFLGISINQQQCMIVTEYMSGGSLYDLLHSDVYLAPPLLLQILKNIASGMCHLHREEIIHRDLAARNCLLTGNLEVKVADFGMSRVLESSTYSSRTDNVAIRWLAPECVTQNIYSKQSDIYSYGVVIYEVMWRKTPYADLDVVQILEKLQTQELYLDPCSSFPELSYLMSWCTKWNKDQRPSSFDDVLHNLSDMKL